MDFNSVFDAAMIIGDLAIEKAMASKFRLQLKDGGNLDIKAIFDVKLEPDNGRDNRAIFIAEEGALTVLNCRINKTQVEGASVQTPLGERHVADVFYPDATTSVIVLCTRSRGRHDGNFLK
ncbi:hypothetical protein [Shewanella frigidimarina]|jgi:hypothetical protein|uniref:hypothetical protein n=1 Tax=Shewanella frigidimarina TaxID=56812 RepID=UPI003D78E0FD